MKILKTIDNGYVTYRVTDENGFEVFLSANTLLIDGVKLKNPLCGIPMDKYAVALNRIFHELYDSLSWDGEFQTECAEAARDALDRE